MVVRRWDASIAGATLGEGDSICKSYPNLVDISHISQRQA